MIDGLLCSDRALFNLSKRSLCFGRVYGEMINFSVVVGCLGEIIDCTIWVGWFSYLITYLIDILFCWGVLVY